jgi:hypothetical protein
MGHGSISIEIGVKVAEKALSVPGRFKMELSDIERERYN